MLTWTCQPAAEGLAVRTAGPAGGQPVVLLHGFFQDGRAWQSVLQRLPPKRSAEILWVAPDLPGHGASASLRLAQLGQAAWPELARLLDQSLRPFLQRPPVVVGYSFGGRAAAYWQGHSSLLGQIGLCGLLLESAHPGLPDQQRTERLQQDRDRAALLQRVGVAEFANYWSRLPLFASQQQLPGRVLADQRLIRLEQDPVGLADHLVALGTGTMPALDSLPNPPCPTALVVGQLDRAYAQLGQRWQQAWPRAHLTAVASAGHNVHLERPQQWRRLVWQLLANCAGPQRLD